MNVNVKVMSRIFGLYNPGENLLIKRPKKDKNRKHQPTSVANTENNLNKLKVVG